MGACSQNGTWTGGWGYVIVSPKCAKDMSYTGNPKEDIVYRASGYEYNSTNNRMEVTAIIDILTKLRDYERSRKKKFKHILIISDSGYAVFPFIKYGWIDKWKSNRFDKKMLNYDLWEKVIPLVIRFGDRLEFKQIRGHGKNKEPFLNYFNDLADKECVKARVEGDRVNEN